MRPVRTLVLATVVFLVAGIVTLDVATPGCVEAVERATTPPTLPSDEIIAALSTLDIDAASPGVPVARPPDELPVPMVDARAAGMPKAYDTTGGDEVTILTHDGLSFYDLDIASNGDAYAAVQIENPSYGAEIGVYRSQDGGDSWDLWGRIYNSSTGLTYRYPAIHISEGSENRCLVSCSADTGEGDDREIIVYHADLADVSASFVPAYAIGQPGARLLRSDVTSDAVSFASYFVYVVCDGDNGDGSDIWFSRSTNEGDSFEAEYTIASLTVGDRDYWRPQICYGFNSRLHVSWYFRSRTGLFDDAIRYRRAGSFAVAGIANWDPMVAVTSASNGLNEHTPGIGAATDGDDVLIAYGRAEGHSAMYSELRLSTDQGATWPSGSNLEFFGYHPNVCRPDPAADWVVAHSGSSVQGPASFRRASPADPLALGSQQILSDHSYWNAAFYSKTVALDESRGWRAAMLWNQVDIDGAATDKLFFDAEWRGDAGYPNMEDGFPVALSYAGDTPPALVDLAGDSDLEIVFSDMEGQVHVYRADGTPLPGWPRDVGMIPPNSPVAIGDLHGDGVPEVAVGTSEGHVVLMDPAGNPMPGFPVNLGTNANTYVSIGALGPPYARYIVATSGRYLYVLNYAGMQMGTGFPVTFTADHTFGAAIGDVDDDGVNEIVSSRANFIHVHSLAGATPEMWRNLGTEVTHDAPTLADLDFDGDLEIAVPTEDGDVYLMDHDGTDFPAMAGYDWPFTTASESPVTSIAFADNLWSSEPELAFAARNYEVYLMYFDGRVQSAYPKATGAGWFLHGAPIVDDVSVVAASVVIGSRDKSAWAWRNTGALTPGWPKGLDARCNVSPASGDIDNDGRNEFVFVTLDELIVVDVNQPPADHWRDRWPMYAHDPMRTGNLNYTEDVATGTPPPVGGTRLSFAVPRPNPSVGLVYLEYRLPRYAAVSLSVFDARGRRVRQLRKTEQEAGPYSLSWDGRDTRGNELAGGNYYVRLRAAGNGLRQELTRKVTLLR